MEGREDTAFFGKFPDDALKFAGEDIAVLGDRIIAHNKDLQALYDEVLAKHRDCLDQIVFHQVLPEGMHVL